MSSIARNYDHAFSDYLMRPACLAESVPPVETQAPPYMMLSAWMSTFLVVAFQFVSSLMDHQDLGTWLMLWFVAFVMLFWTTSAIRATSAKTTPDDQTNTLEPTQTRPLDAQDSRMWASALHDSRIQAEVSRAMGLSSD